MEQATRICRGAAPCRPKVGGGAGAHNARLAPGLPTHPAAPVSLPDCLLIVLSCPTVAPAPTAALPPAAMSTMGSLGCRQC